MIRTRRKEKVGTIQSKIELRTNRIPKKDMLQGDGLEAVKVMWALVAMTTIVVVLRLYTRILVVRSYAIDDSVYNAAFVSPYFVSSHI